MEIPEGGGSRSLTLPKAHIIPDALWTTHLLTSPSPRSSNCFTSNTEINHWPTVHRHSCRKKTTEGRKNHQTPWQLLSIETFAWFQYPRPVLTGRQRILSVCHRPIRHRLLPSLFMKHLFTKAHNILMAIVKSNSSEPPRFFFITHLEARPYLMQTHLMAKALPKLM